MTLRTAWGAVRRLLAGLVGGRRDPAPETAAALAPRDAAPIFRPDTAEAPPDEQHAPPAGWYLDPSNPARLRYWNGEAWESTTAALDGPVAP